jgi:ADP-ribose pyrophosphatase
MDTLMDYLALTESHPELFVNPSSSSFIIILDKDEIHKVEEVVAQRLKAQNLPVDWARVGIVYRDQYIFLLQDAVRLADGSVDILTRLLEQDGAPGIVVLPIHKGNVLLLRHFRHGTRTWGLEIPQGMGTPGLSGEENARKELEEEIGAKISRVISLGQLHQDTSSDSGCIELFFADVEAYGVAEAREGIAEILPTAVSQFERMIHRGEITNVFVLVTYTRAKLHGLL